MISFLKMDIAPGEVLFADDFPTGDISDRWEVTGGEWEARDGILTGTFRGNGGGLIYSRKQYPGDILLDFYGTMLPPCDNDLNFTFRARGWDDDMDKLTGYIGGLNGWWTKQAGLERYPGCCPRALGGFRGEAGREYHIQTGIVGNLCFLFVDGDLQVTLEDPAPLNAPDCARVGLGTYCSQIAFRRFRLYRAEHSVVERVYVPAF